MNIIRIITIIVTLTLVAEARGGGGGSILSPIFIIYFLLHLYVLEPRRKKRDIEEKKHKDKIFYNKYIKPYNDEKKRREHIDKCVSEL